jgi:uncharacterized protein
MIAKWSEMVVRRRGLVIVITLLLLVGVSFGIKNLYFDSATEIWFLKDDPVLLQYDALKTRFGSDDYLAVGIESAGDKPDVLNPETMTAIKKITDFLEEHAAVDKVRSLTKHQYIHYRDDILHVDDVFPKDADNFDFSAEQWDAIRSILRNETLAQDLLFTKDLKHAVVSARVVPNSKYHGEESATVDLAADFNAFVEKEGLDKASDFKLYTAGSATINESFFRVSIMDQSISYPLMVTLIIVLLFAIFRSWRATLLAFGTMLLSSLVCLGFMGYMGWAMNMLNVVIPTVLTVVAISTAVHILVAFYDFRNKGLPSTEAASKAVEKYFLPCFFASLTEGVGFLSLASSRLAPVIELGYVMVIGIVVAFLLSVAFLPAVLSFSFAKPSTMGRLTETGMIVRILGTLPDKIYNSRKVIIGATAFLMIGVIYYCTQIVVDTNFVRYFKENTPVRNGLNYFDRTYKGALSLEFMLDSGKEDGVKEPAFMQRALEFQHYVASQEGNGKATSMTNYIMKVNQVMHDDDPAYFRVPQTRDLVGQYLLLYSNNSPDEDLTDLMTHDGRYMRVSARFEVAPSNITRERVEAIEAYAAKHFPDLKVETSGRAVLFNNMDNYVVQGLASSFGLSMLAVAVALFVVFRSFKYGLLALVPNVIPILIAGAVMGIFGIYLDFATMVVASATFGIAVDDTIHFMSQYLGARREGKDAKEAVAYTLRHTGSAIVFTTIILLIGFSALIISSFVPNILMGVFGCLIIACAMLADLVIQPAILMSLQKRKEPKESQYNASLEPQSGYGAAFSKE